MGKVGRQGTVHKGKGNNDIRTRSSNKGQKVMGRWRMALEREDRGTEKGRESRGILIKGKETVVIKGMEKMENGRIEGG